MSFPSPNRPFDDSRRVAFLYELLIGANVQLAAARANLNRGTAYRWKLEDPEFAALWTEIVASRPRRRPLRDRVLARARRRETSHMASHGMLAVTPRETLWDAALGPVPGARW